MPAQTTPKFTVNDLIKENQELREENMRLMVLLMKNNNQVLKTQAEMKGDLMVTYRSN